jgi:hypothetical protein
VKKVSSLDVTEMPELLRLAEDVKKSGEPRLLMRASEKLAVVVPAEPRAGVRPARSKAKTDKEAFLASLGSWNGLVDTDRLIADIYESRRHSARAPVDL